MKSFQLIILTTVLVLCNTTIYAHSKPGKKDSEKTVITKQIGQLLANPSFPIEHEMKTTVLFTVNTNNEIVVLSVQSNSKSSIVESFIKSRLNYKKLKKSVASKVYIVPITLVSN